MRKILGAMHAEGLFRLLASYHPLSDEFKKVVEGEYTLMSFPKHHRLLEAPQVAGHAYFLDHGHAISFSYVDGKKEVERFWRAGEIIVSVNSFCRQQPSTEFIHLLTSCQIGCLSHKSVQHLYNQFPFTHSLSRILLNQYFSYYRERIFDLKHFSAKQRHAKMIREYPAIEQLVAQEDVASYLGIAPQSLSRLKRRR